MDKDGTVRANGGERTRGEPDREVPGTAGGEEDHEDEATEQGEGGRRTDRWHSLCKGVQKLPTWRDC